MKFLIHCTIVILVFTLFALATGCTKDKALKPADGIDTTACITAGDTITYVSDVKRIMETYCTGTVSSSLGSCHQSELDGGTPGLDYTTYAGIKEKADDGTLINRVFNSPGNPMPSIITNGPQTLTDCDNLKLQAWVDAGALEN
ncbi:MAG: hypothetical protein K1X61_12340 [Chitinophagales bacterium]|nr:hypothetical protein [Chitinophagales bacterium]